MGVITNQNKTGTAVPPTAPAANLLDSTKLQTRFSCYTNHACFLAYTTYMGSPLPPKKPGEGEMSRASGLV